MLKLSVVVRAGLAGPTVGYQGRSVKHFFSTEAKISRSDFAHFEALQTRWQDNDAFGHINNSLYYGFMDDAVNNHLRGCGIGFDYKRFVVESGCRYLAPLAYPGVRRLFIYLLGRTITLCVRACRSWM